MGLSHDDRPYVSRRDFLRRTAVVGAAAAAGPWFWQQSAYAAAAPVRHLHLQFGADAAREATVSWMTPAAVKNPFVELGGTRLRARTRQYPGYAGGWFHSVSLRGLDASTNHRYRVGHDGTAITGSTLTTG